MYSVIDYGGMIRDKVRMEPYVLALGKNINSDSVVLDLGTGTGIFAVFSIDRRRLTESADNPIASNPLEFVLRSV